MGLSDERLAVTLGLEDGRHGEGARAAEEAGREAGVQAGGYVRGGVRERSRLICTSCYDEEDEAAPTAKKKVIILGSGPNRIGQGIEFDYCCCHAAFALREDGYETIMVNCNPETVSTDYDTSDRLYFEPLTLEDVLAVYEHEASGGRGDWDDRAVRRADAAESFAAVEGCGRADHWDFAGVD